MPISTTNVLPRPSLGKSARQPTLRVPAWAWLFLAMTFVFLAVGRGGFFRDPGVFWHTAFGEQVLSGGGIPLTDQHSFSRFGETWLDLQWLGECMMALAYRWAGWDGALLLSAIVLAATYSWLGQRFLATGMNIIPVCVLLALVLAASSHHFHFRPHLASIGFLGLTTAILIDIDRGRRGVWQLVWLAPLFAIWSNIHGAVLGGLASVCFVVGGWLVLAIAGRPTPLVSWSSRLQAVLITLVAALSLLATPHGWQGLQACLQIMRMPLPDVIQEHHPLNLLRVEGLAVVVLGLLYLTTPRKAGLKQFRASWALPAVWLVLAVLRVRHAPLFAMAAGVTLADLIAHTPAKAWLSAHGLWQDPARQKPSVEEPDHGTGQAVEDTQPTKRSTCRGWIVVTAFVGLAMVCQGSGLKLPLLGRGWAQAEQAGWPIALTDELQELKAETNRPLRIFNQLHYGGLIIFHSPESRVFIDDRCELYGFEFLADYARAEVSAPERLQAWDAEYDFDVALVMVGSPFDRFLSGEPSWKLVATDGAAALYTAGD